jgi:hypothetical protein
MNETFRHLRALTLEAVLAAFPLLVLFQLPIGFSWIWLTAAAGMIADRLISRRSLPEPLERGLLIAAGFTAALAWLAVMAGEISPAVILSVVPGADFSWPRYAALLGAFLVFQRGSRVAAADRDQRVAAVRWGTLLAVLSLALSAWLNPQPHPAAPLLTAVLPVLLLLQLGEPPRRAAAPPAVARRSVLITMAIGVLTLPIGLLAAAFADAVELQTAAAEGLRLLLVPIALIGAWLARLINDYLAGPLTAFFSLFAVRLRFGQTQATESDGQQFAPLTEAVDGATAERFADLLLALLILLPLVLLVLMVVVLRRRRRPPENGEELRRSLGVGSLLAQDLRDLLGRLRSGRRPVGLRAALADLTDQQPVTRVRRAVIRALLLLEARGLARNPAEAVSAFRDRAAARFPAGAADLSVLLSAYLPARYRGTADEQTAHRTEQALQSLEQRLDRDAAPGSSDG